jgi:hypothetical protein
MVMVPEPGAPQPPAIDDIANEIKIFARYGVQEIAEKIRAATAGAQMRIGDKNTSISGRVQMAGWHGCVHEHGNKPVRRAGNSEDSMTLPRDF